MTALLLSALFINSPYLMWYLSDRKILFCLQFNVLIDSNLTCADYKNARNAPSKIYEMLESVELLRCLEAVNKGTDSIRY